MNENKVIYLGDNNVDLGRFHIFNLNSKLGGSSTKDSWELTACDVATNPSFIEFLKRPFGIDSNHPAYVKRVILVDKNRVFRLNDDLPSTIVVFPERFEDLCPSFKQNTAFATCIEYWYKYENEIMQEALAMKNRGQTENEVLSFVTQSTDKIWADYKDKLTSLAEINLKSGNKMINVTPNQNQGNIPNQYNQ